MLGAPQHVVVGEADQPSPRVDHEDQTGIAPSFAVEREARDPDLEHGACSPFGEASVVGGGDCGGGVLPAEVDPFGSLTPGDVQDTAAHLGLKLATREGGGKRSSGTVRRIRGNGVHPTIHRAGRAPDHETARTTDRGTPDREDWDAHRREGATEEPDPCARQRPSSCARRQTDPSALGRTFEALLPDADRAGQRRIERRPDRVDTDRTERRARFLSERRRCRPSTALSEQEERGEARRGRDDHTPAQQVDERPDPTFRRIRDVHCAHAVQRSDAEPSTAASGGATRYPQRRRDLRTGTPLIDRSWHPGRSASCR